MPDESDNEALLAKLDQLFSWNVLSLLDLMGSAPNEMRELYHRKFAEFRKRAQAAAEEVKGLPRDDYVPRMLAYFERVNDEIGELIRELRMALK